MTACKAIGLTIVLLNIVKTTLSLITNVKPERIFLDAFMCGDSKKIVFLHYHSITKHDNGSYLIYWWRGGG